jgi:uncharacterized protein GlcG (DUF336 family)
MTKKAVLVFIVLFAIASSAFAQMPVARAIVSDEVAKVTLMKWQINYVVARQVVDATIECALKWPTGPSHLAVFVLSPTGDVVAAQVMDGVAPIGVEAAELKAKTVLYARTTSRAVMERFNSVETRVYRTDLGRDQGLAYYFSAGGIPIVLENQLIGVIGVGGGNGEEPCAVAAYKKVFGVDPPNAIGDRVTAK